MKYLFVLLTLLFCIVNANKPRLYTRIPQYFVDDRVSNFLNEKLLSDFRIVFISKQKSTSDSRQLTYFLNKKVRIVNESTI